MKSESEVRHALRHWLAKANGSIQPEVITNDLPILEQRVLSSLQIMDFILFLEKLTERSIDTAELDVGVFKNLDTIYAHFFSTNGQPPEATHD